MSTMRSLTIAAVVVALPFALAAQEKKEKGGIFDSLAGPGGGNVRFVTSKGKDGKAAIVRAKTNATGEFAGLEASGQLLLTTPQFKLECENLTFDGATEKMTAWGNVSITQEGVKASGGRLTYDIATREVVIADNPDVVQSTPDNSTAFAGMDEFRLVTTDDGRTQVQLVGTKQITMFMTENVAADGKAPAPAADGAAPAGGFGKLGKNVKIYVAPRGATMPSISSTVAESTVDTFRADGSVRVETDDMSLRADRLEFAGKEQLLTATSNVFIKQQSIDSDCGRMIYDLAQDVVTLTVNPVVRQATPTGRTTIKQIDSFVIHRQPDGSVFTEMIGGPDGSPDIFYEQAAEPKPVAGDKPSTAPIEILMDDPASVGGIAPLPKKKPIRE